MAFLSEVDLRKIPFKSIGNDVKISTRSAIYDPEKISIGDRSRIDDFCILSGNIAIGKNVHITAQCNLAGGRDGIDLADFSVLAYGCLIFTQSDDYTGMHLTSSLVDPEFLGTIHGRIVVGKHCIVGARSVVFPGVCLGEGSSVGAMSLVTKSTEPWSIYFGIPAKKHRNRSKNLLELEAKFLEKHGLDWDV